MRVRRWFTNGVLIAAVAGLAAAALPAAAAANARARSMGTGGGLTADFTGDGFPDLLVRERGTGKLKVHVHSGTFDGTATYSRVATINAGWQNMRWIGAMDLTGDGLADVVAIDQSWRMVVAVHSGHFDGLNTLRPGLTVVGYNWNINNLVTVTPVGLLARRADTGAIYQYQSTGLHGTGTFQPPELVGVATYDSHATDVFVTYAYLGPDREALLFITAAGDLYARNPLNPTERVLLGTRWDTRNSYAMTDINQDGYPDIMARIDHVLQVYPSSQADPWAGDPLATYPGNKDIGYGFDTYDVIT